ncbi:hypothetical protein LTR85_005319 [Meristemomyces frigidus]|nr:hypothetical protein LTR85_005319 [Meristemomyces frigidus]
MMDVDPPAKAACFLTALPPELVTRMIEETAPSMHMSLAVTCKYLWECSRSILDHHGACHARYGRQVYCDILPSTVPDLLKTALNDPIAGFHVRSFEIWGWRGAWKDWTRYELSEPVQHPALTETYGTTYFSKSELDGFCDVMRRTLHMDDVSVNHWRALIAQGDDGALKGILFAICGLTDLKSVNCQGNEDDDELCACLAKIMPALLIHIYLDYLTSGVMPEVNYDHLCSLLAAPRALKTLAVEAAEIDEVDRVFSGLETQAASLEALMFYGTIMDGFEDRFMYPTHALEPFDNLKVVILDNMDLLSEALSRRGWELTKEYLASVDESLVKQIGRFMQCTLPNSLEILVLKKRKPLAQADAETIDLALSCFIKDRVRGKPPPRSRFVENGARCTLRAVFLDNLEENISPHDLRPLLGQRTQPWFQQAINAGRESNVYVHTRTTLEPQRRDFRMPLGYTELDLKTSPYYGHPESAFPGQYVLRPAHGICTWRSCENCGDCDYCHQFYPREAWAERKPWPQPQAGLNLWARPSDARDVIMPVR